MVISLGGVAAVVLCTARFFFSGGGLGSLGGGGVSCSPRVDGKGSGGWCLTLVHCVGGGGAELESGWW